MVPGEQTAVPRIELMARDFVDVTVTSVTSECTFSAVGCKQKTSFCLRNWYTIIKISGQLLIDSQQKKWIYWTILRIRDSLRAEHNIP